MVLRLSLRVGVQSESGACISTVGSIYILEEALLISSIQRYSVRHIDFACDVLEPTSLALLESTPTQRIVTGGMLNDNFLPLVLG